MSDNDRYIEEDWERVAGTDRLYIHLNREMNEDQFWEWYKSQPGTIIIEDENGDRRRANVIVDDYKLPF